MTGKINKFIFLLNLRKRAFLRSSISESNLSKIRLTESDLNVSLKNKSKFKFVLFKFILLKVFLKKAVEIVKTQYTKNILKYEDKTISKLFADHKIEEDDWMGK